MHSVNTQSEAMNMVDHFEVQSTKLQIIRKRGGMSSFLISHRDQAQRLFSTQNSEGLLNRAAVCMDEGTPRKRTDVSSAGSLTLAIIRDRNWHEAVTYCQDAGIGKLISHDGCGPMLEVYRLYYGDCATETVSLQALNDFSKRITRNVAEILSLKCGRKITTEHHSATKMYRPAHHTAMSVFFSAVNGFNPNHKFELMPSTYMIDVWPYRSPEIYAYKDLQMATHIAINQTYFNMITADNPFTIFAMGGDPAKGEYDYQILEKWTESLKEEFGEKIHVDAFQCPF